ncbi:MAG TPA: potassium channel protein [Desulfobacteria bacterium]|nr:potassium channel protein [Desulfobacteria bacterium]
MKNRLPLALLYMLVVIILGSIGFVFLEKLTFFQAVYLTMTTITTVGYGDLTPHTAAGRLLSMLIMVVGAGVALYFAGTVVAIVVEGDLRETFGRRKMYKEIKNLRNHIIICGAGRVGEQIIERLKKEKVEFVVIEKDPEVVESLREAGVLAVSGDATEDAILVNVGIEHARGLITALPEDAQNVFVTLTSKGLNPKIRVVARMDKTESELKLKRAGADKVISPAILGGRRMAISILKPVTCEYVDTLIHGTELEMEFEEVTIAPDSSLAGMTLRDAKIKEEIGAIVLAIVRQDKVINNPKAAETIIAGDLLIALGAREQLLSLERLAAG